MVSGARDLPTLDDIDVEEREGRSRNVYSSSDEHGVWSPQCPKLVGLDKPAIKDELAKGYKCEHYPANRMYSKIIPRASSLERSKRQGPLKKPAPRFSTGNGRPIYKTTAAPSSATQPFDDRTYDVFSWPLNKNSLHAITPEDFRYEIAGHLRTAKYDGNPDIYIPRLQKLFEMLVLQRNHHSGHTYNDEEVPGGSNLPDLTVDICKYYHSEQEEKKYIELERAIGNKYFYNFQKHQKERMDEAYPEDYIDEKNSYPSEPVYEPRGSIHLKLTTLCTHLGLHAFLKRSAADCQARRHLGLAYHVWELKQADALNPDDKDIFPFYDIKELLKQYFWGAPKLRQLTIRIYQHLRQDEPQNKVIVLFQYPQGAESYYKALSAMGIRTIILGSDMDSSVRYKKVYDQFNNPDHDSEVLIVPMTLKLLGFAIQKTCHKVFVVEQAANKATEDNASLRMRRIGQEHPQHIERMLMPRTFMLVQEQKMRRKLEDVVALSYEYASTLTEAEQTDEDLAHVWQSAVWSFFGALKDQAKAWPDGVDVSRRWTAMAIAR